MSTKPIIQHFAEEIAALISKYTGQGLSVAEAFGVLSLAALDIRDRAKLEAESHQEGDEP